MPQVSDPIAGRLRRRGGDFAIRVNGLTRYYGERAALHDVSFELAAGQTLSVFGANGAGKTTLLRVLATLLRPHEGEVSVLGHTLPDDAYAVRGRIGLIGHEALVYRELTARENLTFTARLYGEPKQRIAAVVGDMLERVELDGRADEPVRNFSKGMLQRLAAARAMLPQPELLLLDEPRANLDPGAALLLDPFIGPAGHHTRVIVTHDIDYGLEQADLALGLRLGRVEWLKPAAQVSDGEARRLYK
ncbi:MAG: ABC transporter ATP-binding protein [Thermoleophilia bacterium]|nr:ABC transporter ATP-binding protein [Thermoleophilia bacterium]